MKIKFDIEWFKRKAIEVHGNRYDYSESVYLGCRIKIQIKCKEHGMFFQETSNHLKGSGCQKCAAEKQGASRQFSLEDFIKKSKEKHGDKFDYSKSIYTKAADKIKIICPIHGEFQTTAAIHLSGFGCPKCKGTAISGKLSHTKESFLKVANEVHGNRYDYSKTLINGVKGKIEIFCREHGVFEQRASAHLGGSGCKKCQIESAIKRYTLDKDTILNRINNIHNFRYTYNLETYKNTNSYLEIFCKKHGKFKQKAASHLRGAGCPKCKNSLGEQRIDSYLKNKDISFIHQKRFDDCNGKNNTRLPFDFYLPDYNLIIEYDGAQHFKVVNFNGCSDEQAKKNFEAIQRCDNIKTQYCKNNNIKLIRIFYTQLKNIDSILDKIFNAILLHIGKSYHP